VTLILSASDFAIYNNGVLDNTLTGSAQLHSLIDSAAKGYDSGSLPSSSYCRVYGTADQAPVNGDLTFVTVSSSVDGGAYSGSWGDNAISVRAWIRKKTSSAEAFITLKSYSTNEPSKPRGYSILYEANGQMSIYAANDPGFGGRNKQGTPIAVAADTWHRIRLDYIPVGSLYDQLNFYTASAGGTNTETWELVDTMTILSASLPSTWYITASRPSAIGYAVVDYSDANAIYIDDFDVYVTPVG